MTPKFLKVGNVREAFVSTVGKDFPNLGLLLVDDEKNFLGTSFLSALYNTTWCLNNALIMCVLVAAL